MKPAHLRACLTIALFAIGPVASGWAATVPVQITTKTAHYRLELDIGDLEQMFSKADSDRLKPADGEVMVSGRMAAAMGDMQVDPAVRHLELHVRSKDTGKALRDAKVGITVADSTGKHKIGVPIAVMFGLSEGEEDWHYGNNVRLPPGQYVVLVSANRDAARFEVTIADK